MVTRILEPEVQNALNCIENGKNFILTGGAGSGKTYSLISLIEEIGNRFPQNSVTCITYTNNAVAEIRKRITNYNLRVSTIHEYIWSIISKFQYEIKVTLVELINLKEQKKFKQPKNYDEKDKIKIEYFNNSKIVYDDYYSLQEDKESKISHDHILILAEKMFDKYPKLCDILKDNSNFIFVDEYQDTSPLIKDILLKHLVKSTKKNIVGFFGDSMQAIYDDGVGAINEDDLVRINKKQNRRNPKKVIELANKLRTDGIEQIPSDDTEAPNMEDGSVLQGNIKFIYGDNIESIHKLRTSTLFKEWDFENSEETKELWLVQKANARMAGFAKLYELYNSDSIVELITRIRKEVKEKKIETDYKSFESIAEETNIEVRGRGNLLENIKGSVDYEATFDWIKDQSWEEVKDYRIIKESLLSYKFNGLNGKYEGKSQRDRILMYLDMIYELMEFYKNKKFNDFLRKTKYKLSSLDEKKILNNTMNELISEGLSIEQVISKVKIIMGNQDDSFEEFINAPGRYLWQRIKDIPFEEYIKSIEYQKEYLPFATQHSIKGSEFDNVLVVLDNGNWKKYNFEKMFKNFNTADTVVERTKKLFYVCCTRAKKNLCIFMPTTDSSIIEKAIELFGEENVIHHFNR